MQRTDRILLFATLLLLLWGLFGALGTMDLRGEEPRRALIALEMVYSGNYLQPTQHGWSYYNKPPVFTWLIAGCFQLFGSFANWVVRLPSTLAFLLTALLQYFWVRRWVNERTALLASLFFLTTGHLLFFATVLSGEMDLLYSLVVYFQAMWLFTGMERRRYLGMFVGSYALLALGFLIKGLPSIPFQALTLLALVAWYGRWRLLIDWRHLLGLLTGGGLIFAYFYAYSSQGDPWLYLFNLLEEASKKSATESRLLRIGRHLYEFPLQLIADLLPWILLAFFYFRDRGWRTIRENPLVAFSLLFIAANIWIYWISPGTKSRYHYMFYPFFTLLLAWAVDRLSRIRLRTVLLLCLALTAGRVAYNYTVLPYQVRTMEDIALFRLVARQTLQLTGDVPVHWAGPPDILEVSPSFGPFTLLHREIETPPRMPYQIPFLIARENGHLFRYEDVPRPGVFYLADAAYAKRHDTKIIRTMMGWDGRLVLCQFK